MTTITKESLYEELQETADNLSLELEELMELIPEVLEDTIVRAKELKEAILSGNEEVPSIAHEIRGVCLNHGITPPGNLAMDIENNGGTEEKANELIRLLDLVDSLIEV